MFRVLELPNQLDQKDICSQLSAYISKYDVCHILVSLVPRPSSKEERGVWRI